MGFNASTSSTAHNEDTSVTANILTEYVGDAAAADAALDSSSYESVTADVLADYMS